MRPLFEELFHTPPPPLPPPPLCASMSLCLFVSMSFYVSLSFSLSLSLPYIQYACLLTYPAAPLSLSYPLPLSFQIRNSLLLRLILGWTNSFILDLAKSTHFYWRVKRKSNCQISQHWKTKLNILCSVCFVFLCK
jgi:hypothetical protein